MSEHAEKEKWTPPPVGSPCWVEIPAVDVPSCKKFYSSLFPSWEWRMATEKYPDEKGALFSFAGNSGLGGGIVQVPAACKKGGDLKNGVGTTVYHFVDSIDSIKQLVEGLGGKTMSGKEKEGENGWYMYFLDVEGNRFGVYELDDGIKS